MDLRGKYLKPKIKIKIMKISNKSTWKLRNKYGNCCLRVVQHSK